MANLITIIRSLLVFVVIIMLFAGKDSNAVYLIAFVLTILIVSMDGVDGYIARKYNIASKFGAVLDIIGDRIVENMYWITFLALGWIQLWIPILVLTRGIIVDGIRSVATEQGYTAFGKSTMMKSKLGKFLVTSKTSRGTYAAFKGIAFSALILINVPYWNENILILKTFFFYLAYISVGISIFFCVIRGLPVMLECKEIFQESSKPDVNLNPNLSTEATSTN